MSAWKVPAFRLYFTSFFVSNIGTWMHNFAQTWLMYRLTHGDPMYLGYLGFAFAIPMTFLAPFGGSLADRVPRAKVLYGTQGLSAVVACTLALLVHSGRAEPGHLVLSQFVLSSLLAIDNPARQSVIADLVPRSELPSALAQNSAIFTGAAFVGPMIGGALLGHIGAPGLMALNAASYTIPIVAIALLHAQIERARVVKSGAGVLGGLHYLRSNKPLGLLVLLGVVTALFGRSYTQMLPIFAEGTFHRGATGYSALLTAAGLGAIAGAFVLTRFASAKERWKIVALAYLASHGALVGFALTSHYAIAIGCITIVAAGAVVATTSAGTVIQTQVPPDLRGRVVALHVVTVIGLPFFGSLGVTALAKATTPTTAVCMFSAISAAFVGLWALFAPKP